MPLPLALPPGKTVRNIGGVNFLVPKGRRRRFKLPAKTRNKIAASARKIKIPVLTIAINAPPIVEAGRFALGIDTPNAPFKDRMRWSFNALRPYHGIQLQPDGRALFDIRKMWATGANLLLTGLKRTGVFRPANLVLAKSKIPLRLA